MQWWWRESHTPGHGLIKSPNYPSTYPTNIYAYHYAIEMKNPDSKIRLSFRSFSLEYEVSCKYDSLKVYDGSSRQAGLLGSATGYCGYTMPPNLTSSGNTVVLVFHSDSRYAYSGFLLWYEGKYQLHLDSS